MSNFIEEKCRERYGGLSRNRAFTAILYRKIGARPWISNGPSLFVEELLTGFKHIAAGLVKLCIAPLYLLEPVVHTIGVLTVDLPNAWKSANALERKGILEEDDNGE